MTWEGQIPAGPAASAILPVPPTPTVTMSLPYPLAFCVAGVICCSLLALHLLWVATLHRRSEPTVVSGYWDFAATLAGLGGFLIVLRSVVAAAGRTVLTARPSDSWDTAWSRVVGGDRFGETAGVVIGGLVVAVVAVAAWRRRDSLEVHNVDTAAVPIAVARVAEAEGLPADTPAICYTVSRGAGHATVRVRRLDRAATNELLGELRRTLAAAPAPAASAGGWYTAAACGLLGCTLALFAAFFRMTRIV